MITKILTSSVSSTSDWIRAIIMWYLTSPNMRGTISKPPRKPLLHLLLAPALLGHQNPFSMILPTTSFTELLFQHISMDVEGVVNQVTSVKTAQNPKSTNQLRFRKLSSSLTISSSVKILKHNISAAVMIIFQKKT